MIKSQIAMEKYIDIFNKLWEHSENEVVEFKKAETNFDIDELGKYFSALSNEANLREYEFAWIVFGVWDKTHQVVGTSFKEVHPRIALVSLLDIIIKAANSLSLWFPNHIGYERQLIISGLRSKGLLICQYRVQR